MLLSLAPDKKISSPAATALWAEQQELLLLCLSGKRIQRQDDLVASGRGTFGRGPMYFYMTFFLKLHCDPLSIPAFQENTCFKHEAWSHQKSCSTHTLTLKTNFATTKSLQVLEIQRSSKNLNIPRIPMEAIQGYWTSQSKAFKRLSLYRSCRYTHRGNTISHKAMTIQASTG